MLQSTLLQPLGPETTNSARLRCSSGRSQSIPRPKSNRKTKSDEIRFVATYKPLDCSGNRKLSPKSQVSHLQIWRVMSNFLLLSSQFGQRIRTYFMVIDYLYVIVSVNARGLNTKEKRIKFYSWLKDSKIDIAFLCDAADIPKSRIDYV